MNARVSQQACIETLRSDRDPFNRHLALETSHAATHRSEAGNPSRGSEKLVPSRLRHVLGASSLRTRRVHPRCLGPGIDRGSSMSTTVTRG
jgi:hypothetical protein